MSHQFSPQFPVWLLWCSYMATPPGAVEQVSLADQEIQAEVSNLQLLFFQCSPSKTYRIVTNIPSVLIDDKPAGVWLLVISQGLLINIAVKLAICQLSGPQYQKTFLFLFLKKKSKRAQDLKIKNTFTFFSLFSRKYQVWLGQIQATLLTTVSVVLLVFYPMA